LAEVVALVDQKPQTLPILIVDPVAYMVAAGVEVMEVMVVMAQMGLFA
jgi:hypothetical protein